MDALLIGYARVSTDEQDLTAQRDALAALGVSPERTYVDQGLTGTNRERPGLREVLAACLVTDLAVEEPPIEEVIRQLFHEQAAGADASLPSPSS